MASPTSGAAPGDHAVQIMSSGATGSNEIRWRNLTYVVPYGKKGETKTLLKEATGYVRQGQVIAIMGALAGRVADQKGSEIQGDILFNGVPRDPNTWKNMCSYVEQDDLMFTNLSVEETLTYAAKLRLPSSMSQQDKAQKVDDIIMQLNLNHVRKTWIGDSLSRGISGGERKRVAIGVELVTNPSVLFLDEPTSGLDSANALGILETIKNLAKSRGIIVLMTIHQPRTEILELFDKIILLSMGKTLFFGPTNAALEHFAELGHPLPAKTNPSDFFLDIITMDLRTSEKKEKSLAIIEKFHAAYQKKYATHVSPFPSQLLAVNSKYVWPLSWPEELFVLLGRNMKDVMRNKGVIGATIGQAVFLVILIGFVFFRLDNDQAGVQSRTGFLFFICINQTFGVIMPAIGVFPTIRTIFKRERAAGCYRASNANLFFTFVLIILTHSSVALGLAYCIGSAVPTATVGQILGPLIITVFLLFGGLFLNIGSVSWVFRWIQYVSIISYTYKALIQNEFYGLTLQCTPAMHCSTYMGDVVVAQFSVGSPTKFWCILINWGLGLFFLILGYCFFNRTSRPLMRLK
ncbi:ATP-binding cassette sub- G member 2 [Podochytrium sp. JEL0797]|nr:ATP-binding cassette sub- G member 2 [Podochytrium sp. JEL0797]